MIYGISFACAWSLKTEKCILAQQTFFISWRQLKNSPHSKMALLWDHSLERNFKGWKNMVVFRVGKRWGQKLIVFKISLIKHCIIIQHKREWHKKMPFNFSHLKSLIECLKGRIMDTLFVSSEFYSFLNQQVVFISIKNMLSTIIVQFVNSFQKTLILCTYWFSTPILFGFCIIPN